MELVRVRLTHPKEILKYEAQSIKLCFKDIGIFECYDPATGQTLFTVPIEVGSGDI